MQMWMIWGIVLVVSLVIEAATLGLTTVWCAAGALVALVMSLMGCSVQSQIIVMLAVTVVCFVICIIWIKPKYDAKRKENIQPTNADRLIGKEGVVIKAIDPVEGVGQIKVMGQIWSAKSDRRIEEGAKIRVESLEGVKAKVSEIKED